MGGSYVDKGKELSGYKKKTKEVKGFFRNIFKSGSNVGATGSRGLKGDDIQDMPSSSARTSEQPDEGTVLPSIKVKEPGTTTPRGTNQLDRRESADQDWARVEGSIRNIQRQVYACMAPTDFIATPPAMGEDVVALALRERMLRRSSISSTCSSGGASPLGSQSRIPSRRGSAAGAMSPLSNLARTSSVGSSVEVHVLERTQSIENQDNSMGAVTRLRSASVHSEASAPMNDMTDNSTMSKYFAAQEGGGLRHNSVSSMNGDTSLRNLSLGDQSIHSMMSDSWSAYSSPRAPPLDDPNRERRSSGSTASVPDRSLRENFTLLEKLGSGGFSTVLTAEENHTGRLYAAKLVKLKGCTEKQLREVIAEAGLALALRHPSIIEHEDVFVEKATKECVFLMERMAGGSLQDHLMNHPRILSSRDTSVVFRTLMLALSHLHSRDICHCDVKPDNILLRDVDDWNNTKLSDFGLAVRLGKDKQQTLNRVRGTDGFIAPELYRARVAKPEPAPETPPALAWRRNTPHRLMDAGREGDQTPKLDGQLPGQRLEVVYSPAVDIWSAGVTLYSMLGGNWQKPVRQIHVWERDGMDHDKYLFENDAMWVRVWAAPDGKCKAPHEHREAVDLLRWMLHPQPAMRPTSEECLRHPWTRRQFD